MSSNLSQFHFLASTVPNKFDFEADDFDVSQIYQFYSLKVRKFSALRLNNNHSASLVSLSAITARQSYSAF